MKGYIIRNGHFCTYMWADAIEIKESNRLDLMRDHRLVGSFLSWDCFYETDDEEIGEDEGA